MPNKPIKFDVYGICKLYEIKPSYSRTMKSIKIPYAVACFLFGMVMIDSVIKYSILYSGLSFIPFMFFLVNGTKLDNMAAHTIEKIELIMNKKDEAQMVAEEVSIKNLRGEEEII